MALDNIDSSIPLAAGQIPQNFTHQQNAMMQMQMRMQQLRQLQQSENALRQLYSTPGNLDESGRPTANAMGRLMQVDPRTGMEVQNQFAKMDVQRMHAEALRGKVTEEHRKTGYEIGVDVFSTYKKTLDETGDQKLANQRAQERRAELVDQHCKEGSLPGACQQTFMPWDPVKYQAGISSWEASHTKPITPYQQAELGLKAEENQRGQRRERREQAQFSRGDLEAPTDIEVTTPDGKKTMTTGAFNKDTKRWVSTDGTMTPIEGNVRKVGTATPPEPISDDAVKYWGRRVWLGDQIPPMYRDAEARKRIMEEVARLGGGEGGAAAGEDIARKSGVRADTTSLTNITRIADSAEAYENTAIKNMDIVTAKMPKGTATDVGPIINRWLQTGRIEFGSADVPPYATALVTVANEYAKVMSGSTGAQGSTVDSRREAAELLNRAQTTDQVLAVMDVMKQDMENKKASYRDQRKAIQERISGAAEPGAPLPETGGGKTGKGEKSEAPAATPTPTGKAAVKAGGLDVTEAEYNKLPAGAAYTVPGDPTVRYKH